MARVRRAKVPRHQRSAAIQSKLQQKSKIAPASNSSSQSIAVAPEQAHGLAPTTSTQPSYRITSFASANRPFDFRGLGPGDSDLIQGGRLKLRPARKATAKTRTPLKGAGFYSESSTARSSGARSGKKWEPRSAAETERFSTDLGRYTPTSKYRSKRKRDDDGIFESPTPNPRLLPVPGISQVSDNVNMDNNSYYWSPSGDSRLTPGAVDMKAYQRKLMSGLGYPDANGGNMGIGFRSTGLNYPGTNQVGTNSGFGWTGPNYTDYNNAATNTGFGSPGFKYLDFNQDEINMEPGYQAYVHNPSGDHGSPPNSNPTSWLPGGDTRPSRASPFDNGLGLPSYSRFRYLGPSIQSTSSSLLPTRASREIPEQTSPTPKPGRVLRHANKRFEVDNDSSPKGNVQDQSKADAIRIRMQKLLQTITAVSSLIDAQPAFHPNQDAESASAVQATRQSLTEPIIENKVVNSMSSGDSSPLSSPPESLSDEASMFSSTEPDVSVQAMPQSLVESYIKTELGDRLSSGNSSPLSSPPESLSDEASMLSSTDAEVNETTVSNTSTGRSKRKRTNFASYNLKVLSGTAQHTPRKYKKAADVGTKGNSKRTRHSLRGGTDKEVRMEDMASEGNMNTNSAPAYFSHFPNRDSLNNTGKLNQ